MLTTMDAFAVKICSHCRLAWPRSSFNLTARSKDGLQSWCRTCTHKNYTEKYAVRYARANSSRQFERRYGLTLDEIEALPQHCGICNSPFDGVRGFKRNRVVDHDRSTGQPRGLLCSQCNTAIGRIGEQNLQAAADWVREGGWLRKCQPS